MVSDTEYTQRAYTTSEIAIMLDIAVPTVRKYSQALERNGYLFIKGKGTGGQQARLYIDRDIMAFRYLIQLREKSNIRVEEAASIIVEKFGKGAIQTVRSSDTADLKPYEKQYSELKDMIYKQTEMITKQNGLIEGLTQRLDQQQELIDNNLKERDQLLLSAIEERLETQRKIAAAKEKKKGILKRLFG